MITSRKTKIEVPSRCRKLRDYKKVGIFLVIGILVIGSSVTAQKSVKDLDPVHAAALERYLDQNRNLTFRQQHNLSDEYLKSVYEWFGKGFKPNYAVGDFNRDRVQDFAVLVYREGEPIRTAEKGGNQSEEHYPDYPLKIAVFNGLGKGRFRVAFERDLDGPHAAFIHFEKGKRAQLYYSIFETDSDTFILAPAGKGYIMEFEKPR